MTKKIKIILLIIISMSTLVSCKTADILSGQEVPDKDWNLIESSAEGTVLNLYTTELDEEQKNWLSGKFKKELFQNYSITLNVKKLSFEDVMTSLDEDVINEVYRGQIDLILLKDNEFTLLKEKDYLYRKISQKIPNNDEFFNLLDTEINSEHGTLLDDFAIAFGRKQFILVFDEDELESYPHTTEELLEFLKENKKSFTYPNPSLDKTGAEFVRTVIYEIVGKDSMMELLDPSITISESLVYDKIKPALDYLNELDRYLLKDEGGYFKRLEDIDQLFLEGELMFSMASNFSNTNTAIMDEYFPDGAMSFIFDEGTIGDTTYFAVPMNSSNKSGALVAINEAISIDMQLSKYDPKIWGNLPVIDLNLLSEVQAERFKKISVKRNTVRAEELLQGRYPELPVKVQDIINNLWEKHVNNN